MDFLHFHTPIFTSFHAPKGYQVVSYHLQGHDIVFTVVYVINVSANPESR